MPFLRSKTLLLALALPLAAQSALAQRPGSGSPPPRDSSKSGMQAKVEAPKRKYVNSLRDFVIQIESHRQEVAALALIVRRQNPVFWTVPEELLRMKVLRHDQAKLSLPDGSITNSLAPQEELEKSLAALLYKRYGEHFEALTNEERTEAFTLRDVVNARDDAFDREFFEEHGMIEADGSYNQKALDILEMEKTADQVHRAFSPVSPEEFAKEMQPASLYMKKEHEKKRAILLEEHLKHGRFEQITADTNFVARKRRVDAAMTVAHCLGPMVRSIARRLPSSYSQH
jgi:hypothetical protein